MEMQRKRFPTKRAWAEAKAAELRAALDHHRTQAIPSANWRAVRGKMTAIDTLQREVLRFQRLAARFAAEGV